jgi:hypothetical protein
MMMMMNHDGGIATCIALHGSALLGSAWLFVLLLCMPNEKSIVRAFTSSLSCLSPSVFYSDALYGAGAVVKVGEENGRHEEELRRCVYTLPAVLCEKWNGNMFYYYC